MLVTGPVHVPVFFFFGGGIAQPHHFNGKV